MPNPSRGTLLSFLFDMSRKNSYLTRLPAHARKPGDASRGQIEIVTSQKEIRQIESECAADLKGSALGKSGKRLGILLEDDVRMIVRDPLRFPSGAVKCQMRIIGKTEFDGPNGVAVVATLGGRFVMREIFRHPTRSMELETTRGRRETGQTASQAARAEVRQELGFTVRKLRRLGSILPETALLSSAIDVFYAELAPGRKKDDPDSGEAFGKIVYLTPAELARRIAAGKIRDGYTVAALMLAQLKGLIRPLRMAS
jgi:ADP-ribose pyrophosphatase